MGTQAVLGPGRRQVNVTMEGQCVCVSVCVCVCVCARICVCALMLMRGGLWLK